MTIDEAINAHNDKCKHLLTQANSRWLEFEKTTYALYHELARFEQEIRRLTAYRTEKNN